MEMTIEQNKDKYAETKKRWIENNPEKVKESKRKWVENNKERLKEYHHNYYLENRGHILFLGKKWREENAKMDTVYFFMNENEVLYIGSSHWSEIRLQNHLNNNSNLEYTVEELVDMGLSKIVYKDFTKYNLNRTELFYLEQYFKDQTGDKLSKISAFKDKDLENLNKSTEELIEIANKENFIIYEKLVSYLN